MGQKLSEKAFDHYQNKLRWLFLSGQGTPEILDEILEEIKEFTELQRRKIKRQVKSLSESHPLSRCLAVPRDETSAAGVVEMFE